MQLVNVPIFYKEIREAVIDSHFVRTGNFISFFGQRIAVKAATSALLYNKWISQKYKLCMNERIFFGVNI